MRYQSSSESAAEPKASAKKLLRFVEKFSINIFLRFYSSMKKGLKPTVQLFLLQQSLTMGSEAKKQTHPQTAGKLLGVKFYWEKPHQEKKLCGTQRARAGDAGDQHLSWVSSPVAVQMVLNTSHRSAWPSSSLSGWKLAQGFVCSIPDYPGEAGAITAWGGFLQQLGQV